MTKMTPVIRSNGTDVVDGRMWVCTSRLRQLVQLPPADRLYQLWFTVSDTRRTGEGWFPIWLRYHTDEYETRAIRWGCIESTQGSFYSGAAKWLTKWFKSSIGFVSRRFWVRVEYTERNPNARDMYR